MCLIIDSVVFLLVGLYLDNVVPGVSGIKRSWLYFLSKDYWCPYSQRNCANSFEEFEDSKAAQILNTSNREFPFEEVSSDLKVQKEFGDCFSVQRMAKKFDDGKVAVKDFTLDLHMGQVFILLGHNGAGKTTALSMLTGLLVPTSGRAFIKGIDVFKENSRLRKMLGICPQVTITYDELTVEEHLQIFSAFKSVDYSTQKQQLAATIRSLDLAESLSKPTKQLSGGQKRKLSVLLALVGSPAVIMLDEPTSGLDVDSRRKIWEVIKGIKKDKIILMTTHYMDEAEELGDRIGIMSEGEIKCCGSSLFLKRQFKTGYHLTVEKTPQFKKEKAYEVLTKYSYNCQVKQDSVSEIIYNIPFEDSVRFPQMFEELDQSLESVGMSSYGVAITSLEDVFLKVGKDRNQPARAESTTNSYSISRSPPKKSGASLCAVVSTVWRQTIRHQRIMILEVLLSLILFAFSFLSLSSGIHNSYTYTPNSIPKKLPVVINRELLDPGDQPFEYLKRSLPYELWTLDADFTVNDTYHRARSFFEKENTTYEDEPRLGAYYVEKMTRDNLTAMVLGNSRWPLMAPYLASFLTKAYLKVYRPEVTLTTRLAPMNIYDWHRRDLFFVLVLLAVLIVATGVAFSVPVASIAYFLVKERKEGQKFMKMMNGVTVSEYWIGRFIGDFLKFLIPFAFIAIATGILGIRVSSLYNY